MRLTSEIAPGLVMICEFDVTHADSEFIIPSTLKIPICLTAVVTSEDISKREDNASYNNNNNNRFPYFMCLQGSLLVLNLSASPHIFPLHDVWNIKSESHFHWGTCHTPLRRCRSQKGTNVNFLKSREFYSDNPFTNGTRRFETFYNENHLHISYIIPLRSTIINTTIS